ncbi:MAG: HEAT repeat domain-containing protein [Thermodesulfobacteriota bacterium]
MADNASRKKALDFLFVFNAAITNMRLYPPTSAIIQHSVERMNKVLADTFAIVSPLEYAESEKNLLVLGDPLPEKEQQKPQVSTFLALMLDMGIRSISIEKGITAEQITAFLSIVARSKDEIAAGGGLQTLMDQSDIRHITIDEKIYVGMDSEHSIMSGLGISDADFARYLTGEQEISKEVLEQVRQIAGNPEWFSEAFSSGVKQLMEGDVQKKKQADLSKAFAGMISALDGITDADKDDIARYIIQSMSEMDEDVLATVLTQNLDAVFGEDFFSEFVEQIDTQRFQKLFSRLGEMLEKRESKSRDPSESEAIERVYHLLEQTEKGQALQAGAGGTGEQSQSADTGEAATGKGSQDRLHHLKNQLNRIMKGDAGAFCEDVVGSNLAETYEKLIASGKTDIAERLNGRMGDALLNEDPAVRKAVAGIMAEIDEKLAAADRLDERMELSKKLADWVKFETAVTTEFERVTGQMQQLSQELIENDREQDAEQILEAYHLVARGNLEKDEAIQALAGNMLQNVATDAILDTLLKEKKSGQNRPKDDIYSLVILGSTTVERLLDRLYDSRNMSERNRIIQAIGQIGKPALGPVIERLHQGGPWYYLRNLVLLAGRLGDERQLSTLATIVGHADYRVQLEAIKSIQNIGGSEAGRILYEHIDTIDDQLKGYMISVLGALRYRPAAPYLIDLITSRAPGKSKADHAEIREKTCEALGRMQAQEAVTALEKVVRSKGVLGRKTHPENVRSAAARALSNIKRG